MLGIRVTRRPIGIAGVIRQETLKLPVCELLYYRATASVGIHEALALARQRTRLGAGLIDAAGGKEAQAELAHAVCGLAGGSYGHCTQRRCNVRLGRL